MSSFGLKVFALILMIIDHLDALDWTVGGSYLYLL